MTRRGRNAKGSEKPIQNNPPRNLVQPAETKYSHFKTPNVILVILGTNWYQSPTLGAQQMDPIAYDLKVRLQPTRTVFPLF